MLALSLVGCSIIPKRVELGQDKVEKFPVAKAREVEVQRQAAQRAAAKADETLQAAIKTDSAPEVVSPAAETKVLTESVSRSLGNPLSVAPIGVKSDALAAKLDTAGAKLNRRIDDFKDDNNKNIGHKIEGTGFLQVPYIVWLGGAVALFFVGLIIAGVLWTALKMYGLSNPPVALGVKAVQVGGAVAARSVGQLIKGGEKFKGWLKTEVPEITDEARAKIEDLFHSAHKESQDEQVQNVVKELTK